LNILRETVLGRERFDFAFKEYARRWMFKRPMPADFFRTMEDASGTDLDWFWRGWFYTTDNVDIASWVKQFEEDERKFFDPSMNFYSLSLRNLGGLVMPVILEVEFADGTREELRIAAEIWRRNNLAVEKIIPTRKEIKSIVLDPRLETADVDTANNYWPRRVTKSKFQIFKEDRDKVNPMRELKDKPASSGGRP
jgi:hypothetical protein